MKKIFLFVLAVLIIGCAGSPAWIMNQKVPDSANIRVVTHPKLVEDLEFVDGFSIDFHQVVAGDGEKEHYTQYVVYERGYRDVVVFLEVEAMGSSSSYYDTRGLISIYK